MLDEKFNLYTPLCSEGRDLLKAHDALKADVDFQWWEGAVAKWLEDCFPNSGLSATWSGLPGAVRRDRLCGLDWDYFYEVVRQRLGWLAVR